MPRIEPKIAPSESIIRSIRGGANPSAQAWVAHSQSNRAPLGSLFSRVHNFFCCYTSSEVIKAQFPPVLDLEHAMEKMRANLMRAARDRRSCKDYRHFDMYPLANFDSAIKEQELKFRFQTAQIACDYHSMEDAHFVEELASGILAGVFDGHGGEGLSTYLADKVKVSFPLRLDEYSGNVHAAIEALFSEIQESVLYDENFEKQGSTAVVVYVDKRRHLIYTATLGDSVANVYRIDKSVALSPLLNWSNRREAQRAADVLGDPSIVDIWTNSLNHKTVRFPHGDRGINVSRSFGELALLRRYPGSISHKPKITVFQAQPGDLLTLVSDGVSDYTTGYWPIVLSRKEDRTSFAQELANTAKASFKEKRGDDITVVAIDIYV